MVTNVSQEDMKNARTSGNYSKIWQNTGKCVFCDLKDKYVIHKENGVALTINLYPYIDGQLMAIPLRHVSSPKQLSELEWDTIRKFNYIAKKMIRKTRGHKGMWSLIREGGTHAQMSVTDHLHVQFIPFDSEDLCKWNFRELKNTPLENVALYKKKASRIAKAKDKFEKKYTFKNLSAVVCDLIIVDPKNRVLLQVRKDKYKFTPDTLCLPGGLVDNLNLGLKKELIREVREEICYEFDTKDLELVDSRTSSLKRVYSSKYLKDNKITDSRKFIWNTYITRDFSNHDKLSPKDDCKEIIWMNKNEIEKEKRVTKELKKLICKVL